MRDGRKSTKLLRPGGADAAFTWLCLVCINATHTVEQGSTWHIFVNRWHLGSSVESPIESRISSLRLLIPEILELLRQWRKPPLGFREPEEAPGRWCPRPALLHLEPGEGNSINFPASSRGSVTSDVEYRWHMRSASRMSHPISPCCLDEQVSPLNQ